MKPLKLALIGECMIELQEVSPGLSTQTFGGDTLNTAIYSARLAKDLPLTVDYVTALGIDAFSGRMIEFWEAEGVGSDMVLRVTGEMPGLYYIELDEKGERVFHYWRSKAAAKKCFEYPESLTILEKLSEYDGIYLSGISLAIFTPKSRKVLIGRLQELAASGTKIYFDCNYRPHLWTSLQEAKDLYGELYKIADIIFLTTEEADDLLDGVEGVGIRDSLREYGSKEIVVKDGDQPCTIYFNNEVFVEEATKVDTVVDTTAAGDSFSATYLVARNFDCSPNVSAKMAHNIAAYVVCHKGAIAPIDEMPITGKDLINSRS